MTKRRYFPKVKEPVGHASLRVLTCAASVQAPLFMLFLDCVWQMMNQYPAAFEFTETYLTVLGDSMWIPLFSTFLFNSPKQRTQHLTVRTPTFAPSCAEIWQMRSGTKCFCCRTSPRVKPSLPARSRPCFSPPCGSGLSSSPPKTKRCSTTLCTSARAPPASRTAR